MTVVGPGPVVVERRRVGVIGLSDTDVTGGRLIKKYSIVVTRKFFTYSEKTKFETL